MSNKENRKAMEAQNKAAKKADQQARTLQAQLDLQRAEEKAREDAETARKDAILKEDTNRHRRQAGFADTLLADEEDDELQGMTKRLLG